MIATKYIDDSMAERKIPAFARKPIKGGTPAMDNIIVANMTAIILLDLKSAEKSAKVLLDVETYLCLRFSKTRKDHKLKLDIIYTII